MQTKKVRYTFNRGGYYYFTRRVPSDLKQHYLCPRIVQGLNTKCFSTAKKRASVAASKLEEYWSHLRMTDCNLIGQHLLKSESFVKTTVLTNDPSLFPQSDEQNNQGYDNPNKSGRTNDRKIVTSSSSETVGVAESNYNSVSTALLKH